MFIVINSISNGIFGSRALYRELGIEWDESGLLWNGYFGIDDTWNQELFRTDPVLIAAIRKLGKEANGLNCRMRIAEVPDDVKWAVYLVNGREEIHERHRIWR